MRRLFRYSLLFLLLVTTLVCLVVSQWRARQESEQLARLIEERRPVVRALHDRLGVLTIENPAAVHVIAHSRMHYYQVGLNQDWDLAWRLHLPEPTRWRLCWAFDDVPSSGFPSQRAGSLILTTGADSQCQVSLALKRRPMGEWEASIRHRNIRGDYRIPMGNSDWLTDAQPLAWKCAGGLMPGHHGTTQSFADQQPLVLLRCASPEYGEAPALNRHAPAGMIVEESSPPAEDDVISGGVLIWIEPFRPEEH